jgi:hypothetical protein
MGMALARADLMISLTSLPADFLRSTTDGLLLHDLGGRRDGGRLVVVAFCGLELKADSTCPFDGVTTRHRGGIGKMIDV